jgi:uncharacterized protein YbgA (DUF1722 family)/uncharacterized protein YbbK (DUF523 family)
MSYSDYKETKSIVGKIMDKELTKIKIGVSSCLLGENVRFDSGHKKNQYLVNVLHNYFEFSPFCPEVAIGLGVPREPIRLVNDNDIIKCVGTRNTNIDVTNELISIANKQVSWHSEISGYILKKDSPSCGMERVKVYQPSSSKQSMPEKNGTGIYAHRLMTNFPDLPIEEEGRLNDLVIRENFIQRVYVYHRWQQLLATNFSLKCIQQFHATHKYIYMSHDQLALKKLGALLAEKNTDLAKLAKSYLSQTMKLLKSKATKSNHANTLQHIQGYLKKFISSEDKQELNETINQYRVGYVPLIVPITLLRHHFRKHPNNYIDRSFYLCPHPGELMLLNSL